jgi:hypothetical protein
MKEKRGVKFIEGLIEPGNKTERNSFYDKNT